LLTAQVIAFKKMGRPMTSRAARFADVKASTQMIYENLVYRKSPASSKPHPKSRPDFSPGL
jgi:hypothetical protein